METALIILLAIGCAYLGIRSYRLQRAITSIQALLEGKTPNTEELSPVRRAKRIITQVNHAAEEQTRQQRFLEHLLDQMEDAILATDAQKQIRFANRSARQLFGVESPNGLTLIETCSEHRVVRAVDEAIASGELVCSEIALPLTDQRFLISACALESGGAWVYLRDVTLQRETERIRRDFVANAAHELRTPLSVIRGYLEMLDFSEQMPETLRKPIEKMRRNSERLSRLVDDMLTISRLEQEPSLRRDPFRLANCVSEAIECLQPMIETAQARILQEFPDPEASINGDRFYWEQVFLNLLENALKHNSERSNLEIMICHRTTAEGDEIQISDNGVGIPKSDIGHLFKRFYRVGKHRSQDVPGTGLGLSIVKRAIVAHGGDISVQSTPGTNTTFTITLPNSEAGR